MPHCLFPFKTKKKRCNAMQCSQSMSPYFKSDVTGLYAHLTGVPKALLPGVGGKKILDFWWETVNT